MAQYKVEICGVNTGKLPLLTEEEKQILFDKIKTGDRNARDTFIHGNLRLVLSIIQRFTNTGENVDDLFQIGCIGLMKAVDNFDTTLQVKFSTYAVPMIIGEVVMERLKALNPVAYVRFASIYREFKDVNTFMDEIKKILDNQ